MSSDPRSNFYFPLLTAFAIFLLSLAAFAQDAKTENHVKSAESINLPFFPGNLVVSRSVYDNLASNVTAGEPLPPNCVATSGGCGGVAGYNGLFPFIFNNDADDGSFGITSRIFLDQVTPFGFRFSSLEVPNSLQRGITSTSDQLVTSFSSKSELSLHLSTDGRYVTFMGYVAPVNTIDASASNTPGVIDPTNPVGEYVYRAVAQVDQFGKFQFTETNAYSGDNGRGAVLNNTHGADIYYTTGNAGNGGNPEPTGIVLGAGAQIIDPANEPESAQTPGLPTPVGTFNVTDLGDKADKYGKDDNFRGMTIFNNVLYYAKGSGSNGIDTVYFVDTTGTACPSGVGLPSPSAVLPSSPDTTYNPATGTPTNMCILAGFPTILAKQNTTNFPFGIWFANATTLYVADEGDGYTGGTDLYTHAAAQTNAGLEKWVFDSATQQWTLAYTLQNGLHLGVPYTVPGFPTGTNAATGLPWSPATDGLRNLIGAVDPWGNVTIWAITSTISGNGDTGADPDRLVVIVDSLNNIEPTGAAREQFYTLQTAGFGEVLRGVSFTPGTKF
ncbi:MAG TPA: hypothetical protein VFF50_02855 [Candidatus Deferrimicrobiaceae bacterium]|nr:hypothetical protein [Candidatus Deferrimicrobiaceae bacterium]